MDSPAPVLEVQNWMRGEPLANFQPGKVCIVDSWATWCGPGVLAMPYLMELQEEYKDSGVGVVAVAADEEAATADGVQACLDAWLTETLNFRFGLDCTGLLMIFYSICIRARRCWRHNTREAELRKKRAAVPNRIEAFPKSASGRQFVRPDESVMLAPELFHAQTCKIPRALPSWLTEEHTLVCVHDDCPTV